MRELSPHELVTVAMITGAVEHHSELGRTSQDDAVAAVNAILDRRGVPAGRRQDILDWAAAGYTDANPRPRPADQRSLALMVRLGADVNAARAVWEHIHRRGPIGIGDARLG
jgi:hypothetical protein